MIEIWKFIIQKKKCYIFSMLLNLEEGADANIGRSIVNSNNVATFFLILYIY